MKTDVVTIAGREVEVSPNGYEVETCTRCGGTGEYSYNQIHGTRCYGCGGVGFKPTRTGKKTRQKFIDALEGSVADVKVGDSISTGQTLSWKEVTSVDSGNIVSVGGEEKQLICLSLKRGNQLISWSAYPESRIHIARNDDDIADAKEAALKWQEKCISRRRK